MQNRENPLLAVRMEQARAKGLPEPSDPSRFTSVKDPTEPFRFSFPDLTGSIVSNTDPRFRGKVVVVSISGSWCPNCHDEAPFLGELYKKYRAQGLEIVSLSFEEVEQLKNPVRLRAFIKKYGIEYTVLIPGEPKELARQDAAKRQPQLVSDDVLYRAGWTGAQRARRVPGRGERRIPHKAKQDMTRPVERLLAEREAGTF